ncbi:MAG: LPD7 domain-containing protein [Dermatophilaceae bacterium]
MLIRVRGSSGGVEDYLENGRKDGREYGRAELDERVILAGDLELTKAVIDAMETAGEKYLHVTLSFKEDEIKRETLLAITEEFRQFAFAAFDPDEYSFYAEAHLPKIKSYTDRQTGELIERKPHIHVVIPERNLLADRHLNPFGLVEQQTKFLEAFQESVNDRYGLASPKDNRRVEFTDESTIISRAKGDYFSGANHDLKERILADVLARGVTDFGAFAAIVAEHGATRTRNADKPGAYLNVKLEGAAKGINLKEYVFSREFIALPDNEKRSQLAGAMPKRYEEATAPRQGSTDRAARLKEWREVRAHEIKYLNSGNKKVYQAYKSSDTEQRRAILTARAARFYAKHRAPEEGPTQPQSQDKPAKVHGARPKVAAVGKAAPPQARGRLRDLADLQTLQMEPEGERLPRPEPRPGRSTHDGRAVDNVVGQLTAEQQERSARGTDRAEFDQIKKDLDPARLLAALAQSHGVMPEKYEITTGQDGSARVKAGKRNLNVSDFLTVELHLPWGEASRILLDTYAAQLAHGQTQAPAATLAPSRPNPALWADYRRDWPPLQRQAEAAADKAQRDSERKRRADLRQVHQAGRRKIQGDKTLTPAAAKAARSVLAMTKVQDDMTLREAIKAERAALKAARRRTPLEQFRAYLTGRASKGDVDALGELRRQRIEQPAPDGERIEGREAKPEAPPFAAHRYQVDHAGNVTYYDQQRRAMFTDNGPAVRFQTDERKALEAGLRLALVKYGENIKLNGSDEYKTAMIEIAADSGLRVTFDDPASQARYIERRETMRLGREYIDRAGTPAGAVATPAQHQEPPARPPEAQGAAKVQEAAAEAKTTPAALDRARDRARAEFRDPTRDRSERIRSAGVLCGLQDPLGARTPEQVAAEAAKVVGPLGALDKDEFMRGVRSGVQQRQDVERQARDLAPTTKTPEPKGKSEDGPAPTTPTRPRKSGHSR